MIKSKIIHPDLLFHLSRCGHKTKVLIADANYSFVTNSYEKSNIVYLNLTKGMINIPTILESVLQHINVEEITMMACPDDFHNTIVPEYLSIFPSEANITYVERYDFYNLAKSSDTLLVIASGEQRRFSNLILTVGIVV